MDLSSLELLGAPRRKWIILVLALAGLALSLWAARFGTAWSARLLLAGIAVMAGALAVWGRRTAAARVSSPLQIISRVGLSSRCGLALVEADGKRLLVAYGDGFAQFAEPHGLGSHHASEVKP